MKHEIMHRDHWVTIDSAVLGLGMTLLSYLLWVLTQCCCTILMSNQLLGPVFVGFSTTS